MSPDTNTTIGFGLYKFSIDSLSGPTVENIKFSAEQEDVFGTEWVAARVNYRTWQSFIWVAVLLPLICAFIEYCRNQQGSILIKLTRRFLRATIPVVIVCTILMSVPLALMRQSNMCGPSYVELGYENVTASSSADDDDFVCDRDLYVGTNATFHDDLSASCDFGASGVNACALIGVWPLVLLVQGIFLNARANRLEEAVITAKNVKEQGAISGKQHFVDKDVEVVSARIYDDDETAASSKIDSKGGADKWV